jgi:hypothetical protein
VVSILEVVVLVVGLESLQVVSFLGVLPLVLNKGMGGVVALRWRGGMVHGLPFVVLTLVLSRLFDQVLVFEFQVGDLKNIWLIDSGCSRHMTGGKGWF